MKKTPLTSLLDAIDIAMERGDVDVRFEPVFSCSWIVEEEGKAKLYTIEIPGLFPRLTLNDDPHIHLALPDHLTLFRWRRNVKRRYARDNRDYLPTIALTLHADQQTTDITTDD